MATRDKEVVWIESAVLRGDEQAIDHLRRRYGPRIFRYFQYRLGDSAVAERLTAQVFDRLLGTSPQIPGDEPSPLSYLYRIARPLLADYCRRRGLIPSLYLQQSSGAEPPGEKGAHLPLEYLGPAMTWLTSIQQEVVLLRFIERLPHAEVASILNLSEGTIRDLQYQALANLRGALEGKSLDLKSRNRWNAHLLDISLKALQASQLGRAERRSLRETQKAGLLPLLLIAHHLGQIHHPRLLETVSLDSLVYLKLVNWQRRLEPTRVRQAQRFARLAVAPLLILVLMIVGGILAALGSLPGDTLYPVKRLTEDAQVALTFHPEARSQLLIALANERLTEVASYCGQSDCPEWLLDDLGELTEAATREIAALPLNKQPNLLIEVIVLTQEQQVVLEEILTQAPATVRQPLEQAMDRARRGNQSASSILGSNPYAPDPTVMSEPTGTPQQAETSRLTTTPVPAESLRPTPAPQPSDTPGPIIPTLEPSASPEQTRPPQPTHTPRPTSMPEPTKTRKPSQTPEPTLKTPKPTATLEPTKTRKPSQTPKRTDTPEPTLEIPKPTATPEPTKTPKHRNTPEPTATWAPSVPPDFTATPGPVVTPKPTKTPRQHKTPKPN